MRAQAYPKKAFFFVLIGGAIAVATGVLDLVALAFGAALGVFDDLEAAVVSVFSTFIIGVALAGLVVGGLLVLGGFAIRGRPERRRRRGIGVALLAALSLVGWGAAIYYFGDIAIAVVSPVKLAAGTVGFIVGPAIALAGGLLAARRKRDSPIPPTELSPGAP